MNIILFSLDTLRADRLSCYGHQRQTSPHLDRLAAQGALFTEFFSPHIPTFPGHTTMMTGRDVYAHHITGQSGTPELPASIPMLAEILQRAGYFTGAADNLGRWFTRGFELYEGYQWETAGLREWRKAEAVTSTALRVIDAAASQDRPFFLFLHYWDPHTPYLPPAPFSRMFYEGDERDPANTSMAPVWEFEAFRWYFNEWMPGVTDIEFPKAQYDAEIAYMDACLAHVFARIEAHGLLDGTLLVFTADHGEELDEHGCWFDHHGLYDPNVRIPLVLRLPGRIAAGARVPGFTRTQDIVPTVLDYANLLDPALRLDGASMRPLLEPAPGRVFSPDPLYPARGTCDILHLTENTWMKKRALRTHAWKLITALEPDIHGFPMAELYDLTRDPGEQRNLAEELPDVVAGLRAQMDEHVRRRTTNAGLPDPLPTQPIPLRRIGRVEEAVPRDEAVAPADEKLCEGDFVGYEREEEPAG
ncbi:MAG: sulfatase [Chthonomonadales bacterium]|nr:sulfatase [Chthonomonadales bacterium]